MRNKNLLIVESPAKAQTITHYLGEDYEIESSMGHIRDLSPRILSIDLENGYTPYYEVVDKKKNVIDRLQKAAEHSKTVLLATDPDREGEAIAFHLRELLKKHNPNIYRILFHEITRKSVQQAVSHPRDIDQDKVNSQQMRRLLDRLAGYKISPVLQKKIGGPLSAGRVQSIALKLIVNREKEILAHEPEEYWIIEATFQGSRPPEFLSRLDQYKGKKIKIRNAGEKDRILADLEKNSYILDSIKKTVKKKSPSPPFITSTLQQTAYNSLNFPVKKTMRIAQQLYEGIELNQKERTGLITYMRTDSYRLSSLAQQAAGDYISRKYGADYHPGKFNVFGKKTRTQDAHEAIRPTLPLREPASLKNHLNAQQLRLYQLIWNRFLASQMQAARIEQTTFHIRNGEYRFLTQGEIVTFPGFLKVLKDKVSSQPLPALAEQEKLVLQKIDPQQNFTKPPARYTEASLVRILEKNGIGRPSTYSSIIDILNRREYVYREDKKFKPSFLGIKVVEFLENHFQDLMEVNFTANLEGELDKVSRGQMEWQKGIDAFYQKLKADLDQINLKEKEILQTDQVCPRCHNPLVVKYSYKTRGWFIACSAYPGCNYIHKETGDKPGDEKIDRKCPQCNSPLVKRYSPKTRSYFIGCSGYPRCKYIENTHEDLGACPECQKPLVKRFSRKTKQFFVACSGYPDCRYIQKKTQKK